MENNGKTVALADIQGSIDVSDICAATCPFLASKFDDVTPMAFPHTNNHCYRYGDPTDITIEHQREYCLAPAYDTCPVYLEKEKPVPHPQVSEINSKKRRELRLAFPVTAVVLLLLFAALMSWPVLAQSPGQDQAVNAPLAVEQIRGLFTWFAQDDQPATIEVEEANPLPDPDNTLSDVDNVQPARQARGDFRAIQYPPG